jgi:hypothetical protein
LIKTGIFIYEYIKYKRNEGDEGPPPLTSNYLAAFNNIADGNLESSDSAIPTLEATYAIFKMNKDFIEELYNKAFTVLNRLKDFKTKNSPIYCSLVKGFWTTFPDMVFAAIACLHLLH